MVPLGYIDLSWITFSIDQTFLLGSDTAKQVALVLQPLYIM